MKLADEGRVVASALPFLFTILTTFILSKNPLQLKSNIKNKSIELPNITSLRFFLALLVILLHVHGFSRNRGFPYYNDLPILNKGLEAVFMFFALSGFLIIRNLYMEKKLTGTLSIKRFYQRRVQRIFPLYYFVLFVGILYYFYLLPYLGVAERPETCRPGDALILGGTFFANILEKMHPGGIIEILWSLGIEEQFYIIVAPTLFFLPIKRIRSFLLYFSILYFVLFAFRILPVLSSLNMYFFYFSLGGFFSLIQLQAPNFIPPGWLRYSIYGLIFVYFFSDIFRISLPPMGYQLLSAVLFCSFIWCFTYQPFRLFQKPILLYFGKISYGIYLLHAIAIQITGFIFLKIGHLLNGASFIVLFNVLVITLTLVMAHYSYQYFELRFMKTKGFHPLFKNNSLW